MIGDVIGKVGRAVVARVLPTLKQEREIDFVIANAENAAGGFGLTHKVAEDLFSSGIDALTGGNHSWNKKEIYELLEKEKRVLRPLNYPSGVPGEGFTILRQKTKTLGVINLCGRIYLDPIDCPFKSIEERLDKIREEVPNILVDIHAEATSEKVAMGYFLDGKVSAVIGTHTHVQTADEKILPGGTAYLTDVGMTGPVDSVIGMKKDVALKRFLARLPFRLDVANGKGQFCAVLIQIDPESGRANRIERIQMEVETDDSNS